eukprot:3885991-Lingulodinium_polyedra.AAC.1
MPPDKASCDESRRLTTPSSEYLAPLRSRCRSRRPRKASFAFQAAVGRLPAAIRSFAATSLSVP